MAPSIETGNHPVRAVRSATLCVRPVRGGPARRQSRSGGGFTLIELLVVLTLIVVLAGMGLATYATSITRSKEAVLKEDLFRMRDAIDQYYADKAKYPADLQSLAADGYLRKVPQDPFTESADTWQTTPAEIDAANPAAEPGIFDVKSGADATALDGSKYADW